MSVTTVELRSVTRTRKTVNTMLWVIVSGAVFYSLMTSTPLVSSHSLWHWSGWALGALTDAAFVLAISADATLSRYGMTGGRWPTAFRWITGLASLFLNTWGSVSTRDWVGVAIHSIAPVILVCAAEVAPIYRRKFRELEFRLSQSADQDEKVTRNKSEPTEVTRASEKDEKVTRNQDELGTVTRNKDEPEVTRNKSEMVTQQVTRSSEMVTPEKVTRNKSEKVTVPRKVTRNKSEPEKVTRNQDSKKAIRDAYLEGLSPTEAALKLGKSRPYISKEFKKFREEMELTA